MLIDDKLKNIKPYLVSLRYEGKTSIMDVRFKKNWVVPESKNIKVQKYAELENTYMFYSDKEDLVIDDIATYVSQVIEINVEREEKMILLRAKIEELQEFFIDNDLVDLKRMVFKIPEVSAAIKAYEWTERSTEPYIPPIGVDDYETEESDAVNDSDFDEVISEEEVSHSESKK